MNDLDFPEGQRSRAQRKIYVESAVHLLLRQVGAVPSADVEALFDRYVEGEILLQDMVAALTEHPVR